MPTAAADPSDELLVPHATPAEWSNSYLLNIRALVFLIWFLVQVVLVVRLFLGSVVTWRIRRSANRVSSEWYEIANNTAQRLGLRRVPRVLASSVMTDAAAYGFFRSIVLVPASWLTEMPPELITAILAHEFSHIRRRDAWVNLLQRVIEIVFFYHPAVWWLSTQLRIEREHCCDLEAVAATGNRRAFASALEQAARHRAGLRLVFVSNLGGDRMSLLNRVNRVLENSVERSVRDRWPIGLLAAFVPLLLTITATTQEIRAVDPAPEDRFELTDRPDLAPNPVPEPRYSIGRVPQRVFPAVLPFRKPPSEHAKVRLPDYVIEPPDILLIDAVKVAPKPTYQLKPNDKVHVVVLGENIAKPIVGEHRVASNGTISLGPGYEAVKVAGRTLDEATKEVTKVLERQMTDVKVAMSISQAYGQNAISGEHLVAPDGTVNLGIYGRVYVAGHRVGEARQAIEKALGQYFDAPNVALDVFAYNSKFFYVILENDQERGDSVVRIPVTGNETVLDAISQTGGFDQAATTKIWISRPSPNGSSTDQLLPWTGKRSVVEHRLRRITKCFPEIVCSFQPKDLVESLRTASKLSLARSMNWLNRRNSSVLFNWRRH